MVGTKTPALQEAAVARVVTLRHEPKLSRHASVPRSQGHACTPPECACSLVLQSGA